MRRNLLINRKVRDVLPCIFFFSSRRRHTRWNCDWSSDVCSSDLLVAEIGDKTQLLALLLALKFRKPWPIMAGMLAATLANHAAAGAVGHYLEALIVQWAGPDLLRWGLALGFALMAAWTLIPDKIDDGEQALGRYHMGAFFTTLVCFFLVEMGDKTQIATVALAARYSNLAAVV